MTQTYTQLLGGLGLFLLGMLLLTDGLKAAAGDALKRILMRFTGRPFSAFVSGVTITAMVQSSSATTLATIGFVSAGLLTFTQAVGIVIGGSVGTTTTGWLVSLLGLKLSIGQLAMPLVGVGALMRLVLKGRRASLGLALAGFGLIFVGIEVLQSGMAGLAVHVRPETLPAGTFAGRLVLVGIGIVMTVIMQSSSAAIATTITAFHAGTINLDQALTLVIGASIGTTVTAALAAIGASVPARRTALAHILFNAFAGGLGFWLQPLFVMSLQRWGTTPDASSLAIFHTAFNLLGAALVLPTVERFSRVVIRLVPDRGPALTRHLDRSLTQVPEVAVEAVRRTLVDCALELFTAVRHAPRRESGARSTQPAGVAEALHETRRFLADVPPFPETTGQAHPRLDVVHALDHLDQLTDQLDLAPGAVLGAEEPRIARAREKLLAVIDGAQARIGDQPDRPGLKSIQHRAEELAELRRTGRQSLLEETAAGRLSPETASEYLDAVRWLDTVAYHAWRTAAHLCPEPDGEMANEVKEVER
jgi:phosphate:Na+ symporter